MALSEMDPLLLPIVTALESVTRSTEEVYLRMGQTYPSMLRELQAGLGAPSGTDHPLLRETNHALERIRGRVGELLDQGTALGAGLFEDQLGALDSLGKEIEQIREDSVLMELISLNALVIAVKAGESGRAFSCITSELKKLSNQTMELADRIAGRERVLATYYHEFQVSLTDAETREREGLNQFIQRFQEVFVGLDAGARTLLEGLDRIRAKAEDVKPPLVDVMVQIQNQDRIRQSIDHVLLSLGEFRSLDQALTGNDAELDELSFLEILPDLGTQVLEEVASQIRDDRGRFQGSLAQARNKIQALEEERRAFLAAHLGHQRPESLEGWFASGQELLQAFVGDGGSRTRARETAYRKSSGLQKSAADLVESLQSFDGLLAMFRNIDLASRIQVARQSALASMKDNAQEMTVLTGKIGTDVGRAISLTDAIHTAVGEILATHRSRAAARARLDETFDGELQEILVRLQEVRTGLLGMIQGGQVFTQTFLDQFALTSEDMGTLDALVAAIDAQKVELGRVKAAVSARKAQILKVRGLPTWKLENQKLRAMIERFTIFTHKKFAAELGNFEIEAAAESGEVTLF
jgi:hypothetical protein